MSGARKILIFGGLGLATLGMLYGLYYAVFVEHQTLDSIGGSLAGAFVQAAERRLPEAHGAIDAYAAAEIEEETIAAASGLPKHEQMRVTKHSDRIALAAGEVEAAFDSLPPGLKIDLAGATARRLYELCRRIDDESRFRLSASA